MKGKGRCVIDLQEAMAMDDAFSKSQKHVFEITFSNYSLLCGTLSNTEMREWQARLSILLFTQIDQVRGAEANFSSVPEPSGTVHTIQGSCW